MGGWGRATVVRCWAAAPNVEVGQDVCRGGEVEGMVVERNRCWINWDER